MPSFGHPLGTRPPPSPGVSASLVSSAFDRRRNPDWRARLEARVRAEFTEMPGMHLSVLQAQRLFGLRRDICERILDTLVREGCLCTPAAGIYCRRDVG